MLNLIVAMAEDSRVIGLDGDMPWKLGADLKRFKKYTSGHTVVMGRKTWESIPEKFRPLPNRHNIVLTRQESYEVPTGVDVCGSLEEAIAAHGNLGGEHGDLWVIGGEGVFAEVLPQADKVYATLVQYDGPGDTYFPANPWDEFEPDKGIDQEFVADDDKNSHASHFLVMTRKTTG